MIADLSARPSFCDHFMHDYRIARIEASGEGAAARFSVDPPGAETWVETVISEAERPHLIAERGRCGRNHRVPVFTAWELTEGAGVTNVRVTFWSEPSMPIDRLRELRGAGRWYRRRWRTALRRLTRVIEGDEPVRRVEVAGGDRVATLVP
jgi:hypothetical protein